MVDNKRQEPDVGIAQKHMLDRSFTVILLHSANNFYLFKSVTNSTNNNYK